MKAQETNLCRLANLCMGVQNLTCCVLRRRFEQICGGFPDALTRCCQLLEVHVSVDFVDINMGCPIDVVCNRQARRCRRPSSSFCSTPSLARGARSTPALPRARVHAGQARILSTVPAVPRAWPKAGRCCCWGCRGAGSALLQKPAKLADCVRASSAVLSCPLTIKLRKVRCCTAPPPPSPSSRTHRDAHARPALLH